MNVVIIKIIDILMIALSISFSVAGVAGIVAIIGTKKRYPPRDQSEADGYNKAFWRITALYLGAAATFFFHLCLS